MVNKARLVESIADLVKESVSTEYIISTMNPARTE